jgi:hypothetical protein
VLVEAAGLLGFGMDQQAAAADGIVEAGDPGDPIDQQQGCTETLAFRAVPDPAGCGRSSVSRSSIRLVLAGRWPCGLALVKATTTRNVRTLYGADECLTGSTAIELSHLRAVEQAQQSLEFATAACGGVELEGKSASIKSISECIQLSNASSFSSCFLLCFERSICISLAGSRRQLSICKKERKGGSDEPDAPLLLERELAVGEVEVVIGGKRAIRPTTLPADR